MKLRAGACALIAFAAFASSLSSGFVYDDNALLFDRLKPEAFRGFGQFWNENYWGGFHDSGLYRPLGLTLVYAEKKAFGAQPLQAHAIPYHVIGLLLYGAACVAAFWLLSELLPLAAAFAAACIFAAHPVHAEAAATLYGQLDSSAALGVFLSLLAWRSGRIAAALILCFAALCFKETAIVTPLLAILIAVEPNVAWKRAGWFAIPVGAYLALRFHALGSLLLPKSSTFMHDYSLAMRIKVWIVTAGEAMRASIAPWAQTVYYGHLRDELLDFPYADTLWIACAIAALWLLYFSLPRKYFVLGVAWFAIAFLPMSNLLPTGVIFAERSMFLPVLGVAILAGSLVIRFANAKHATAATAIIVAIGIALSNHTAWNWRNEESLWRTAVADHPGSPFAHAALGWAIVNKNPEEAREQFREALDLNPASAEAQRGITFLGQPR